jgi:Tfp pilus assembly protein PilO
MAWNEVVLTLGLSVVLGLPVLGFTMYWTAEFLGLRVERAKAGLSPHEAQELRAQVAALQARVAELEGVHDEAARLEERVEFLQRLLEQPADAR